MRYEPKTYWNQRAWIDPDNTESNVLIENMREWLNVHAPVDARVLEVGSGAGRIYKHLPVYYAYHACDIAPDYAAVCFERTGIQPQIWDGRTLPYVDNEFDLVISFSVMLHVPPEHIRPFIREHLRVSRHYLFVSTYTGKDMILAPHCFEHDYATLFAQAHIVEHKTFPDLMNDQWLLRKD